MPEAFLLPEVARSLRTFGDSRDTAGDAAHAAIFTPLRRVFASADGARRAFTRRLDEPPPPPRRRWVTRERR